MRDYIVDGRFIVHVSKKVKARSHEEAIEMVRNGGFSEKDIEDLSASKDMDECERGRPLPLHAELYDPTNPDHHHPKGNY